MCLKISSSVAVPMSEIDIQAVRAQGAGGQNVNKVSTAIHLRFDINASSLPRHYKDRLLRISDHRMSKDGVVVIKAQQHRTQEKNKQDALERLGTFIRLATIIRKKRKATRPSAASRQKRLDSKKMRGKLKRTRGRVGTE